MDNLVKVLSIPGKDYKDAVNKALRDFAVSFMRDNTDPAILSIDINNIDELKSMIIQHASYLRGADIVKPVPVAQKTPEEPIAVAEESASPSTLADGRKSAVPSLDAPALSLSPGFAKENHLENFVSDGKIGEYISGEGKLSLTVDFWKGHHRSDPHKRYIVARVGGLEIGFAVYDILADEASLRLHRIVIMDGYKRSGIGQCMMGAIFDHAKSLHMQHLSLMCLREDASAVEFYKTVSINLHAAIHFGDQLGAVWWDVSYHISSNTLGFEAAAGSANTAISYESIIDQKYAYRLEDSCKIFRNYDGNGQSVILYAEDIFDSGAMIDLESAVNKMFTEYKILEGGKIIIFAREELNAIALAHMIKRSGPDIDVITITREELYRIKPDAAKGEAREAKAVIEYARTKGAKDILALIRGPVISPKEVAKMAKSSKIPVIQVGVERAFSLSARQ